MKLAKALSHRIKDLRNAVKLSQQEVAVRGDLSLSLVAKLEQGKKADPRASTLLALATALGVRPGQLLDDLLPRQEEPKEEEEKAAPEESINGKKDKKKSKNGKKKKK